MDADVLYEADMHRVIEKRVKIEQHVNRGFRNHTDVFHHVNRLGVHQLRREIDVQALQPVGDGPAKQWYILGCRRLQPYRLQHAKHSSLVAGLHDY